MSATDDATRTRSQAAAQVTGPAPGAELDPAIAATLEELRSRLAALEAQAELATWRSELAAAALENVGDVIEITDADGLLQYVNPAFERLTGYAWEEAIGRTPASLLRSDQHDEAFFDALWAQLAAGRMWRGRLVSRAKTGELLHFESTVSPILDEDGRVLHMVAIKRDIGELMRAEAALRESEERFRRLAEASFEGVAIHERGRMVDVNSRLLAMFGYEADDVALVVGRRGMDLVAPEHHERVREHERRDGVGPVEVDGLRRDGSRFPIEICTRDVAIDGRRLRVTAVRDVSDRRRTEAELKEAEAKLRHEAAHHALTGLPNRGRFLEQVRAAIARQQTSGQLVAVLLLDLDRFKIVNESLGHAVGDKLLVDITRRIVGALGPRDMAAHLGGDEFAVVVEPVEDASDAQAIAERLQGDLAVPFTVGAHEVFTSASIGIALTGAGHDTAETLLRDAEAAMYRAKAMGKARHVVFDTTMHLRAVELLQLESDLRRALERGEFRLHYQPIVALDEGNIVGFEALLRWEHPERGLMAPGAFIPVAEETGLMVPIGQWVMREACRQVREWQETFPSDPPLMISVNLSGRQFAQQDLVQQITATLGETRLEARHLKLEMTESIIMDNAEFATALLSELRSLDLQLFMDDFGTGYSSLSYLHRFPTDSLKIDRSFVSTLGTPGRRSEIVRTIVHLARNLGMSVVAEGVETAAQLDDLRLMGCDYGQGYFFSRPIPSAQAADLLGERPRW